MRYIPWMAKAKVAGRENSERKMVDLMVATIVWGITKKVVEMGFERCCSEELNLWREENGLVEGGGRLSIKILILSLTRKG